MTSSPGSGGIPTPRTALEVPLAHGAVTVLRRHGNPRGARILLSHGNGLAADLYYPFWAHFLADFEVVVFDCRNHGWNRLGAPEHHNPQLFAEDLETLMEAMERAFGRKPCVGIFHSLSALVSLLLPSKGARFDGLVLFDPPLCKPGISQVQFEAASERMVELTRRRVARFESEEQFLELAEYSPMLGNAVPEAKRLLARTTLRPRAGGDGYELRCPAEYEAQAIEFVCAYAVWVDLDAMDCPVKVVGADPTVPFSYLPSFDPRLVVKVDYDFLPEIGHLVPLEAPRECHALCLEFMERHGIPTRPR